MDEIILNGNGAFLTKDENKAYVIKSGKAFVFTVPVDEDGATGRRVMTAKCREGDTVPGLFEKLTSADGSGMCDWAFLIVPVGEARLIETESSEDLRKAFAGKTGIRDYDDLGFGEAFAENYRLWLSKDLRNFYADKKENDEAEKATLYGIYRLFESGTAGGDEKSGNAVYDSVAYLCRNMKIDIAPLEKIQEGCGRRFTIYDIARISGFLVRDIHLDSGWYKKDAGAILAFTREGGKPVACVPRGMSGYGAYNTETGTLSEVNKEMADALSMDGIMFYRPFPRKSMTIPETAKFVLSETRFSDIVYALVFALLGIAVGLLVPYVNQKVFDVLIPVGDTKGIWLMCSALIAGSLGAVAFALVKGFANIRIVSRSKYALQAAVYERLFNLPDSFVSRYDSAELAQNAFNIPAAFDILFDSGIEGTVTGLLSFLYLTMMVRYGGSLAWTLCLLVVIVFAVLIWLGFRRLAYNRKYVDENNGAVSIIYQLLGGVAKLRTAGAEKRGLGKYMTKFTKAAEYNMHAQSLGYLITTIISVASSIFTLLIYYAVTRGNMDMQVGSFIAFVSAFGTFSVSVFMAAIEIITAGSMMPYIRKAEEFLKVLPEQGEGDAMPGDLTGEIEVNNVDFGYEEGKPVLRDISFHIDPGEYIGIVGSSGCGKSTLLKLLLGFEKPQNGKIYYDGRDIDSLDKRELRKKMGVVLQSGSLITGSIYENVTITAPGTSAEKVMETLEAVGLGDDIKEMPMGIYTLMSDSGGSVSGGQKQRILIARAIVGKPKIIYFDEATSALDNTTQAMVTESLEKLKATRVVIAHRLSTIINCDRIFVLDKGHIVESGNYEELMAQNGLFRKLAERQIS